MTTKTLPENTGEDAALVLESMGEELRLLLPSRPEVDDATSLTSSDAPLTRFDPPRYFAGFTHSWPTLREAELILWVRKSAPTLPAVAVRSFARRYVVYEARQESTERFDWILAYHIWEGAVNREAYESAVAEGEIPGFTDITTLFWTSFALPRSGAWLPLEQEGAEENKP